MTNPLTPELLTHIAEHSHLRPSGFDGLARHFARSASGGKLTTGDVQAMAAGANPIPAWLDAAVRRLLSPASANLRLSADQLDNVGRHLRGDSP